MLFCEADERANPTTAGFVNVPTKLGPQLRDGDGGRRRAIAKS